MVVGGSNFSVALKADGTVWSWGTNGNGQLGHGTKITTAVPTQVEGLENIKQIAAGESHALALTEDGEVWAWGLNNYGQLGQGNTTTSYEPIKVKNSQGTEAIKNIRKVVAGRYFTVLLTEDGRVYIWI